MPRRALLLLIPLLLSPLLLLTPPGKRLGLAALQRIRGRETVQSRLDQINPAARDRIRARFESAHAPCPPARLTLLALKHEKQLHLFAPSTTDPAAPPVHVHAFPILAASGTRGPKLREGDRQVPEGFYRLDALNPNSSYHLSMRVNYPNQTDLENARADNRSNLGGDIYIHGRDVSIGCLAIGDEPIEELFTLASDTGLPNIELLIAPHNLLRPPPDTSTTPSTTRDPAWLEPIYAQLKTRLATLPIP